MKTETKIYYSHPITLYGSNESMDITNLICCIYVEEAPEVINPEDVKISDEDKVKIRGNYTEFLEMEAKYFYPLIKDCDIFVYDDKIPLTGGVREELKYAKQNGLEIKTIRELRNED
jgi:hypothetical protein